ncbi:MAG: hypothetical protein DSZ29_08065, partial [Aquificaceae bacterium]
MKKLLSYFILWFVLSIQASAAMVSPIGGGYEGQSQYIVKLESMPYVYRLNIYDDNHVLLVLQQHCIDGYRAIQSIQDKAWFEANGCSLGESHNAVLNALGCSLRASQ